MPKILVIEPLHESGLQILSKRADIVLHHVTGDDPKELAAAVVDADGITVRNVLLPAALLDRATQLKVVSRHGVGFDNIAVDALTRRGIPLALAVDSNADSVAEHTLFMMLALAKQAFRYDRAVRQGEWSIRLGLSAVDLRDRHLLIIGFGRTGSRVGRLARAFGMRVSACDPYIDQRIIEDAGCQPVKDFRTLLETTDLLSVHTPRTPETRGMIGSGELARMPTHALVINCARGGIVDEAALAEALRAGRISGAGLDVFEQEPPDPGHPLLSMENVILSPHSAGVTLEAGHRCAIATAENVLAGLEGRLEARTLANPEVLRRLDR